ncbi:uncharacterized protein LOC127104229 [Lathyrus oleraceus]|uniref:uncharacterized protein LOC127104229 n=1 Tax=Pisum sativum TaxID=3888 RepID=UPI0021D081D3|nr:uncharacterized protein LOC127104229 [Pisum sativum]
MSIRGFAFTSMCSHYNRECESTTHIFFHCKFVSQIWKWFSDFFNLHLPIKIFLDYKQALNIYWTPQLKVTFNAYLVNIFFEIWKAKNIIRYDEKLVHWKSCVTSIVAATSLSGNQTRKDFNSSMNNLCILKKFKINIHQPKIKKSISILWKPSPRGWIKCNIDGLARGVPSFCSCGGIFRNESTGFWGSFTNFLGDDNVMYAELSASMTAVEQARDIRCNSLWIESNSTIMVKVFTNVTLVPQRIKARWLNCVAIARDMRILVSH